MKVYIWKRRDRMTDNYHDEGGAVAVAPTLDAARIALKKCDGGLPEDSQALTTDPDITLDVANDVPEYAEVFPDAGCC